MKTQDARKKHRKPSRAPPPQDLLTNIPRGSGWWLLMMFFAWGHFLKILSKILQNPLKSFRSLSNPAKSFQILQNPSTSAQILSNHLKSFIIPPNPAESVQILQNPTETPTTNLYNQIHSVITNINSYPSSDGPIPSQPLILRIPIITD